MSLVASAYSSPARSPRRATMPYTFESQLVINDSTPTVNGVVVIDGRNFSYASATAGAIVIQTAKDVVIQNCRIQAPYGIQKVTNGDKVTVYNTIYRGINPNVAAAAVNQFMNLTRPSAVDVQFCEWDGNGILINGVGNFDASNDAIRIKYNKGRNALGLISDGFNGWVFEATGTANTDLKQRQHIQIDSWNNVQGSSFANEIAFNEFRNSPGRCRVEDNVNMSNCGGTSGSPINLHDNFVRGAYNSRPFDLAHYSGGGVITEGTTSWMNFDDNIILQTHQYGLSFYGGTNLNGRRNFCISSQKDEGQIVVAGNVALVNYAGQASAAMDSNTVWWANAAGNPSTIAGGSLYVTNTTVIAGVPQESDMATYEAMWQGKLAALAAQGIVIGSTLSF